MSAHMLFRFFILCLLAVPLMAGARTRDGIARKIQKQFPVSQGATLLLNNRFGDITCINWDKMEISVEVTITVETSSEEKAQKIFNAINISFVASPGRVEVRTEFPEDLNTRNPVNVDYRIWMPASVSMDVTNKFGDVFVPRLDGKGIFHIAYGNANLEKLNHPDNQVDVKFGSATIGTVTGTVIRIQYSRLNVSFAGTLKMDSKFSDMQIDRIDQLEGTFEGGQIDVGEVSALLMTTKFSGVEIRSLGKNINLDCKYGSIDVREVSSGFQSVKIFNKFGNVSLHLPTDARYTLDMESKFSGIKFPEHKASFTYREISDQGQVYRGSIGDKPSAVVVVRTEFGSVSLW